MNGDRITTSRRRYLTLVGVGSLGALAGCLGDDGLDDDEQEALETWIDDGFEFNRSSRPDLQVWLEDSDERELERFSEIESDAFDLLERWNEDIDPITSDIEDTSFERTVDDMTQTVDGADLVDAMEELREIVEALEASAGIIVEADGDGNAVGEDDRGTIEETIETSFDVQERINELWYFEQV